MQIEKVRQLIAEVVTEQVPPEQARKNIAVALLHIAEGIEELRVNVAHLMRVPPPAS